MSQLPYLAASPNTADDTFRSPFTRPHRHGPLLLAPEPPTHIIISKARLPACKPASGNRPNMPNACNPAKYEAQTRTLAGTNANGGSRVPVPSKKARDSVRVEPSGRRSTDNAVAHTLLRRRNTSIVGPTPVMASRYKGSTHTSLSANSKPAGRVSENILTCTDYRFPSTDANLGNGILQRNVTTIPSSGQDLVQQIRDSLALPSHRTDASLERYHPFSEWPDNSTAISSTDTQDPVVDSTSYRPYRAFHESIRFGRTSHNPDILVRQVQEMSAVATTARKRAKTASEGWKFPLRTEDRILTSGSERPPRRHAIYAQEGIKFPSYQENSYDSPHVLRLPARPLIAFGRKPSRCKSSSVGENSRSIGVAPPRHDGYQSAKASDRSKACSQGIPRIVLGDLDINCIELLPSKTVSDSPPDLAYSLQVPAGDTDRVLLLPCAPLIVKKRRPQDPLDAVITAGLAAAEDKKSGAVIKLQEHAIVRGLTGELDAAILSWKNIIF
ncbi:uncharacterized protein LAESUDRAFT_710248 [Laetiporus sulphureus 93-53]|uniref:Uncharacterized protein n=1 Tax=Laetiporus sulphureus 93-53 TaxID=1314785 RepID=A0A165IKE8_9APHY|nr:uncharacterized protein LAESUDRAFT_710248 [Laetiporus sulphureus 93-53]KZT13200.1 hypothetical protein LAESUDRAFT_710248 [Laetiporus sulphureus 93-53]